MWEAVLSALWMLLLVTIACTVVAMVAGTRLLWQWVGERRARQEEAAALLREREEKRAQELAAQNERAKQRREAQYHVDFDIRGPEVPGRDSRPNPLHDAIRAALAEQEGSDA